MTLVLITAGAKGIGYALAAAFAASGSEVWITDIDKDALQSCPASWRKSCVDVSDEAQMAVLFEDISRVWGGLDAVCANAGIAGPTAKVEDVVAQGLEHMPCHHAWWRISDSEICKPVDEAAGRGAIISDLLYRRAIRLSKSCALCGCKMGCDRSDENPRDGAWSVWYSRERNLSWCR